MHNVFFSLTCRQGIVRMMPVDKDGNPVNPDNENKDEESDDSDD